MRAVDASRELYEMNWPGPVDSVVLLGGGMRMQGANQYGVAISGVKTGRAAEISLFIAEVRANLLFPEGALQTPSMNLMRTFPGTPCKSKLPLQFCCGARCANSLVCGLCDCDRSGR